LRDGKPLLIKAQTPMNISDIGFVTLAIAGISTILMSLLGIALFWTILKQQIVNPLNKLTNHVVAVGETGDLSRRMALERDDEIGVLSKEFNSAVEQLESVRRRLLEKSYQSGMAEIAAGVIHNVRNALSPVVVTVSHLSDVAVAPPVAHLSEAFEELKSANTPPERRQLLVEYIEAAVQTLIDRGRRFAEDLKGVAEQNRHIEQILHDHTALSMGTRRLEPVNLALVVEEAARFIPSQDSTIVELKVSPKVAEMPHVYGHTIVVTQILGNLMVNAAEAIRQAGRGKGAIEIDARLDEENGRPTVHLTVRDDGIGIDPAVLPNLFGRGFSTKKGKTGGIGLHWSANSIAAMGGQMSVDSEGTGRGATFHVVLPVAAKDQDLAA
jgi:signal transduction histidine kinase